ncbi:fibrous sheath CABYR-binding protein-like [Anarrhichthys ocellatus]|uniref:fibrous sheath CABYR-binding protein-like n=1 Tax=Anarrhichthys ocellatus TaxID=433405 RepID=UPI0012EE4DDC|nr:fibrous sheath CABYR-binding protein-like [Anarrhichthys ocellatus]
MRSVSANRAAGRLFLQSKKFQVCLFLNFYLSQLLSSNMGCSSSSAQTVDQEKRPGTKPEESNGDTVAARNGIIAEDAQTIEDQMQLPVQTALPDDLQRGADDEAEAVLVALEAQEDLGSGEDLLSAPEPQPEPVSPAELVPEAAAPAEVATEAVEEAVPVETVVAAAEVEALVEATEEAPAVESVVQTEAPAVESVVQTEAPVVESVGQTEAPVVESVVQTEARSRSLSRVKARSLSLALSTEGSLTRSLE